ncbi:hypothetical protein L1049_017727 [Liquidambar formosana]|uniref:Alpha/beta hydrolase fold-3 domain-containing protein n=1 Tax=Liquidambar formosana TaxID=63359 RepID=A0AAP0S1D0_LIQFO
MDSSTKEKEVVSELLPYLRVYKDGTVERLLGSPHVPPSLHDPETDVTSKDIIISQDSNSSARLYLPKLAQSHHHHHKEFPILVYFHGGGFCIGSAFSLDDHRYLNILTSQAKIVAASVE